MAGPGIIRHPYESLPSHVSIFYTAWQAHSPEIPKVSPVKTPLLDQARDTVWPKMFDQGEPIEAQDVLDAINDAKKKLGLR